MRSRVTVLLALVLVAGCDQSASSINRISDASEGSFFVGASTIERSAPSPDVETSLMYGDAFFVARIERIGRSMLNTDTGEFVESPVPVPLVPLTPVTVRVSRLLAKRSSARVESVREGDQLKFSIPGGAVRLHLDHALASRMFLVDEKADPGQVPSDGPVDVDISMSTGLTLKSGDTVVVSLRVADQETVGSGGATSFLQVLTVVDNAASMLKLDGKRVTAGSSATPDHMPQDLDSFTAAARQAVG